jgi:cellulose synthase/poly-beta-1,6-N-acetylglucosamine synthase-like glycosyltransferase
MTAALWLLLFSLGVVVYGWVVYPLLICALRPFRRRGTRRADHSSVSFVSIIIPVHNEEQKIAVKLRDCLELLYPNERLEILVASDGSTDRTEEIVREFVAADARIRWIESDGRVGKSGVQNLGAGQARGDILFFTDANTAMTPGVLRSIADGLADPTVGLVTATVHFGHPEDAVEKGQGFYWRYELFLRAVESDLGILATGSGQALAVRRELFRPLPPCYGDDCIMPLDVRLQGFKVIQNREATVFDAMPHSIEGELRARIRMTARNWAGTLARPAILNPLRFPLTAVGLVSHKLLRWLTPFFLAVVFLSNAMLALEGRLVVLWWLQVGFYFSAFVGWELTRKQRRSWVFGYPFSFCLANVGFFMGMVKAFRNQKIVAY